jgi:hypothetical protein
MTWRWPWRRREAPEGSRAAAAAKAAAEQARVDQARRWPEVLRARDELARLAEQAMRRPL